MTLRAQFNHALERAYQSDRSWRFAQALRWYSLALRLSRRLRSQNLARRIAPDVASAAVCAAVCRIFCGQISRGVTSGLTALPELRRHASITRRPRLKRIADWAEFIFKWHQATVFTRPLWLLHRRLYEDLLYIFFRYDPNDVNYIDNKWSVSEYSSTVDKLLPRLQHADSKERLDRITYAVFRKQFYAYSHTPWRQFRQRSLSADHKFQRLTADLWSRINRPAARAELKQVVDLQARLRAAAARFLPPPGKRREAMCLALQAALRSLANDDSLGPPFLPESRPASLMFIEPTRSSKRHPPEPTA